MSKVIGWFGLVVLMVAMGVVPVCIIEGVSVKSIAKGFAILLCALFLTAAVFAFAILATRHV